MTLSRRFLPLGNYCSAAVLMASVSRAAAATFLHRGSASCSAISRLARRSRSIRDIAISRCSPSIRGPNPQHVFEPNLMTWKQRAGFFRRRDLFSGLKGSGWNGARGMAWIAGTTGVLPRVGVATALACDVRTTCTNAQGKANIARAIHIGSVLARSGLGDRSPSVEPATSSARLN
jgi:hypothetical protein